jgi:tetratricopeptide (TPR) repeat protein
MWERYNVAGQQALSAGKADDAVRHFQLALQEAEKEGLINPKVATSLINLANTYRQQGKYAEAEPLYQRAIQVKEKSVGPLHKEMVPVLENYAKMLRAAGRVSEAEKLDKKAMAIFTR